MHSTINSVCFSCRCVCRSTGPPCLSCKHAQHSSTRPLNVSCRRKVRHLSSLHVLQACTAQQYMTSILVLQAKQEALILFACPASMRGAALACNTSSVHSLCKQEEWYTSSFACPASMCCTAVQVLLVCPTELAQHHVPFFGSSCMPRAHGRLEWHTLLVQSPHAAAPLKQSSTSPTLVLQVHTAGCTAAAMHDENVCFSSKTTQA
jgi:hypothetical protein